MAQPTERSYRRFTAVVVVHRELSAPRDVSRILGNSLVSPTRVPKAPSGWSASRMEYLAGHKYYPDNVGSTSRERDGGRYAHDVYVAAKDFGDRIGRVVFVASPYTAFLHDIVGDLVDRVGSPAMQFLGIDMPVVYQALDSSGENAAVNRVTMQVVGEPNADVVALAGKRPLHSKIHDRLSGVTVPYGIGVNVHFNKADCRVSLDRHGRINWYQTAENRVAHPLALLDRIANEDALLKVRRFPLEREPRDAVVSSDAP
jgi:hypothetical protein